MDTELKGKPLEEKVTDTPAKTRLLTKVSIGLSAVVLYMLSANVSSMTGTSYSLERSSTMLKIAKLGPNKASCQKLDELAEKRDFWYGIADTMYLGLIDLSAPPSGYYIPKGCEKYQD